VGNDKKIRARSSYGRLGPGQDISGSQIWKELEQNPVGLYQQTSVVDGIVRFYAYRQLSEYPLVAAIGISTDDIDTNIQQFKFATFGIALLITLGVILTLIFIRRDLLIGTALHNNQARLASILDIAPEGVIVVNEQMNIILFNYGAERIFDYDSAEIIGKPMEVLIPPKSRMIHASHVDSFINSGAKYHLMANRREISGLKKDGSEFPAEASVSKMATTDEILYTVVIHDISQRKKAEAELNVSMLEAEYANYTKTQFLANMSHELRTPLNSIIGFSQVLMGQGIKNLDETQTKIYAKDINYSANHLLSVIQDILDVSKIEAGELELEIEAVNFDDLVTRCIMMNNERARDSGIELLYIPADPTPIIMADELRLKQVMLNLINNGIKFTPEGGTVEISTEVEENGIISIHVKDTGIGIKESDIPTILEPFGQIKDIMRRNHEGTGLGLSISKSLVDLHGGSLTINSIPDEGTTVTISLPIVQG
jgi:PAS domain S-box-containing protein